MLHSTGDQLASERGMAVLMGPFCQAGGSAFVTMTLGMPLEVVMRRMQVGLHNISALFKLRHGNTNVITSK